MKKTIRDLVRLLGGTTAYSGKTKTMYVRGVSLKEVSGFKGLPFTIVIS